MELPNEELFPFSNRCYDQLPILIAAIVRETYLFIKSMQPISQNYNCRNLVKQIKIAEENLSQSCILCQLLRKKTLASGSNIFFIFTTICLISTEWI